MHKRIGISLMATVLLGALAAQTPSGVKVVPVPVAPTSAGSGQQMFNTYCASCHGKDGRGDGPAAAALKKAPADLTTIAARNNNTFPELEIYYAISGEGKISAHGSQDMPVWGDILRALDTNTSSITVLRITNLTNYIKSLQKK